MCERQRQQIIVSNHLNIIFYKENTLLVNTYNNGLYKIKISYIYTSIIRKIFIYL